MSAISLVFPHQLFDPHPAIAPDRPVLLVEETLFFNQYRFHKQKLMLHRATMKNFAASLQSRHFQVHYVEAITPESDVRVLLPQLAAGGVTTVFITALTDNWLEKRLNEAAAGCGIRVETSPGPGFLNQPEQFNAWFGNRKTYYQTDFYTWQRKSRNLLMAGPGKPLGGKWTFDSDNRQKVPKNHQLPHLPFPAETAAVEEARLYTEKHYAENYGYTSTFIYPVTHSAASGWLEQFLNERFSGFGPYEDAMLKDEAFLYHSLLSPLLNTGLLTPEQVLSRVLETAATAQVPLQPLEGFVRQLTGWREFIRIVYEREGSRQRTRNFWGFSRKIPESFYTGETGIQPVDTVIKRVLKYGYAHHIERLMVLGNFMLLCEFDPDEVYRWFMEMFTDSYDWVMVPNVYGMTQFADGGLMTTKPYISGSNYLLKMGNWDKGTWQDTWDGLFWRFMHVHRGFFGQNPRLGMLLNTFDKMPAEKRMRHLNNAELFLQQTAI